MIRKVIITTLGTLAVTSVGWTAEDGPHPNANERIGVASGAVLGGLAGGPLGLVFGAALGGWLGDEFDTQRVERDDFEDRWQAAEDAVAALRETVSSSEERISRMRADYREETSAMRNRVREALDVEILFKTGASDLADTTSERLERLGKLVAGMDDMLIRIEGHADARGDAEYNEQLSAHRAAIVRDTLLRAGVPAGRFIVDAMGETDAQATPEDIDGMALERRVQLTLIPTGSSGRVARE